MCLLPSKLQAPVQALFRPGVWLPGIRSLHQCHQTWQTDISPENCYDEVLQALHMLEMSEQLEIYKADRDHLKIEAFFYTKTCMWLDVVELDFQPGQTAGSTVKARSFSSGFLPIWIPLVFLLNMVLFFIPFHDMNENRERLERIREAADIAFGSIE